MDTSPNFFDTVMEDAPVDQFLQLLDAGPTAADSRKRPMFDFLTDYGDVDEPPTAASEAFSWPSFNEGTETENEDIATDLLSIPSFDNIALSRTTSLDNCLLSLNSQPLLHNDTDAPLSRANSTSSKPFRIPDSAKALLDSWFSVNINDPYLKGGDAAAFAHLTGLSEQQVKTYIANRRSRKLGPTETPSQSRQASIVSLQSVTSSASLSRRRGRRRFRTSSDSLAANGPSNPGRIYHCTFAGCNSDFARKGDWKRHEQSSHMPQEEWICLLTPPVIELQTGDTLCGFCGSEQASDQHLEVAHRYSDCVAKAEIERTFGRKDKLTQHLAQVHKVERTTAHIATNWRRQVNRVVVYVCGFCGDSCEDWNKRADHIAGHFEAGLDIALWMHDS